MVSSEAFPIGYRLFRRDQGVERSNVFSLARDLRGPSLEIRDAIRMDLQARGGCARCRYARIAAAAPTSARPHTDRARSTTTP
jgi:hypothetical protein